MHDRTYNHHKRTYNSYFHQFIMILSDDKNFNIIITIKISMILVILIEFRIDISLFYHTTLFYTAASKTHNRIDPLDIWLFNIATAIVYIPNQKSGIRLLVIV